jgi:hypothetical protein
MDMKKIIGKVLLLSCCALIFDVVGSSGQSVSESPHIQVDTENPTPAHDDLCTVQTGVDHGTEAPDLKKVVIQERANVLMMSIAALNKDILWFLLLSMQRGAPSSETLFLENERMKKVSDLQALTSQLDGKTLEEVNEFLCDQSKIPSIEMAMNKLLADQKNAMLRERAEILIKHIKVLNESISELLSMQMDAPSSETLFLENERMKKVSDLQALTSQLSGKDLEEVKKFLCDQSKIQSIGMAMDTGLSEWQKTLRVRRAMALIREITFLNQDVMPLSGECSLSHLKEVVSSLKSMIPLLSCKDLEEVNEFLSTQFGDQST